MVVVCSHCQTAVYRLLVTPTRGDTITASQFEGIDKYPSPVDGERIECPECGEELWTAVMKLGSTLGPPQ